MLVWVVGFFLDFVRDFWVLWVGKVVRVWEMMIVSLVVVMKIGNVIVIYIDVEIEIGIEVVNIEKGDVGLKKV